MKKRIFTEAIIVFALFCLITPIYAETPWLHADANKIKDPNGNIVVLRGVDTIDIGASEVWYGGMINLINRITDKNDTSGNSPGWYTKVIRLAIYPQNEDGFSGGPKYYETDPNGYYTTFLRPIIDHCKTKDIYAIIDWHYVGDNTYDRIAETNAFWSFMAPKFAGDSHVLFELFNEPLNNSEGSEAANWARLKNDMQTWINIIRASAPNNLILVGAPSWSQQIGPAASNPFSTSNPNNTNLVMVVHLYPGHWLLWGQDYFKSQVTTCLTRYPVFASEWGFWGTSEELLNGTITNYGQPLMNFYEENKISHSAWCVSYAWNPPMFNSNWTLRVGEAEMGGFVKDMLYAKRFSDQPGGGSGNILPTVSITSPLNGDLFFAGDNILIEANASDTNGYVTKVEFYQGATKLGEDTNAPYSYLWTNVPLGRYSLTARATDNNDGVSTSSAVSIGVTSGDATGFILREWWTGLGSGNPVSDLTSDINYPNNPNGRALITSLEAPTDWANNYGTRIRGYLYPPADGNYTFWIASDDYSQLWLSTDDDPCHTVQIAYVNGWTSSREWTKYPSQTSTPKPLLAGHKYYIEALHKEGTGGDNIAVAWQGPGVATRQVIDGVYLSPYLYNFKDYSVFAPQWLKTNCSRSNAWCSGADRDRDGNVGLDDLMNFAQWWLLEAN